MSEQAARSSGRGSFRGLDWGFEQRPGCATAHHVLLVMARRANKPPHHCFMSHRAIAAETERSLSTVGRAIRHLKDGGVIAEIRSEPRLRRLGIRTYCLLIGHDATGQNDRPDRSKCALSTRHFDRENPEKTKRNRRESGDGRKSRKGREAFQIGELIITTMD